MSSFLWGQFAISTPAIVFSDNPEIVFAIGEYNFGGGAYNTFLAERAYRKTLALDAVYPLANYQLGRIAFTRGQPLTALSFLNRELELYPDHYRAYYMRGLVRGFDNARDLVGAEKDFRTFISYHPDEWAGHNDLAWVLLKAGKWEEARDAAKEAFDATGDLENPWLWNSLGAALLNLHQYQKAQEAFTKALEYARDLGAEDWRLAYPGNDPRYAEEGIFDFKNVILANLKRSEELLSTGNVRLF
ncbi:MAG: tetratricopeptide repeat protein [Candidatus Liptonbacteria bacterium]|nr:tetratricopeptide repeat protein [Candidatus Liptonbacteria bacterium]